MHRHLDPAEEQALLERARQQAAGIQELYAHYYQRVFSYMAYRVRRHEDVEDLVATVFLKVIQGLARFEYRSAGSLAAWIFRIAYNEVVEFQRRAGQARATRSLDELPGLPADAPLLDDLLLQQERFLQLRRLLATLSPRRQELITLKFFGGLRNKEIAAVLGLDERSISSQLCRALDELQDKFLAAEALLDRKETGHE